jgi:type VI secretion system secreted protein Hcp
MKPTFLLVPAALAALAAPTADAASHDSRPHDGDAEVQYFLKLGGIDGESTDARHRNEIELASFGWGATNAGSASPGGGSGSGKVALQDFHFTTRVSAASPKLFVSCASGKHIKSAVITARKSGNRQLESFLRIELDDVIVSSYHSGAKDAEEPVDSVDLGYSKIVIDYAPRNPDGSIGTIVTGGWDAKLNREP